MKTFFAPAHRLEKEALAADVSAASVNPVIDGLLGTVSGLLVVLNEQRQILAVNDSFLKMLGIDGPERALGLRPGEAIGCIHSDANEGGCGTSTYCVTCGAAIAMVTSLEKNAPIEKECAVTVNHNGTTSDLFLRVRACPISMEGRRMILLFIQDITNQQQWEALGRVFFHDLNNIICGLMGTSEILLDQIKDENHETVRRIHQFSLRLAREVQMQKHLAQAWDADYQPMIQPITVERLFDELSVSFADHPAARHRTIDFIDRHQQTAFNTDFCMVMRVLGNMVTNALEATDKDGAIKVWCTLEDRQPSFYVWNHQAVPAEVTARIFQRNISTKAASGRGLGTYSMKLFGETFLNGKIDFTTSASEGTTFCFSLPRSPLEGGRVILAPA